MKKTFPPLFWRLLFAAALLAVALVTETRACECEYAYALAYAAPMPAPQGDSWIFARSRYSHDPETGVRVAQYTQKPPVEPLPDQRAVSSGYARSRTVLRGPDGNVSTYYRVQNYGNGRGGIDAEWERFHDAWRGSTIAGGNFSGGYPPYGYGGYPGYGFPGSGFPGSGFPGTGYPGYGGGGYGGGGYGGGVPPGAGYGPGHGFNHPGYYQPGTPDPRGLDPDGADGFYDHRRRTPDRRFFGPNFSRPEHGHDHDGHGDHGEE